MQVELLAHTPNPEFLIEEAARLCYDSVPGDEEKRKKFLAARIKAGDTSTIEHASATFKVTEVSRALTHELVRHRVGMSYSQRSQRYCLEDGFGAVVPETISNSDGVSGNCFSKYEALLGEINKLYVEMVSEGIPKEDARYILPNACHTKIIVTGNFTAWRHFLHLRLSPRAQWEIRGLAREILRQLHGIAPTIFEDFYEQEFGNGKGGTNG